MLIATTDCHPDVLNFLSINAAMNLGQCPWGDDDLRRFLNDPPDIFEDGANQTKGDSKETSVEIRYLPWVFVSTPRQKFTIHISI